MPNWCDNRLTITHTDTDVLDNFMARVRADKDERLFCHIKPMPNNVSDWYNWCIENWGTKWDACNMSWSQIDDNTVEFSFETAWAPPTPVYEALALEGFEVEAHYVEYGMMYAGSWHCDADGNVTDNYSNDISESVPQDADEVFDITNTLAEWADEYLDNAGALA